MLLAVMVVVVLIINSGNVDKTGSWHQIRR
jgi:hypothetical protein